MFGSRVAAAVLALSAVLSLSGCATVDGMRQDADRAGDVAGACTDAAGIGGEVIDLVLASLRSGSIAFENSGEFIDAVVAMDTAKVESLSDEATKGMPETDVTKFRASLDRYGEAVRKCRLGIEAATG